MIGNYNVKELQISLKFKQNKILNNGDHIWTPLKIAANSLKRSKYFLLNF